MKLEDIFIDYLKSGGSWMESTLVVSSSSKKSKELKSNEVFMRYCDLKKRDGAVTAKLIRDEKRLLQDELDKKPKIAGEEPLPYIFAHPDLPGSEDWELIRVFDSATVVASDKRTQEAQLSTGPLELDGQQTRMMLPAALGYNAAASGSADPAAVVSVLPQPSGLRTLGSKESLEREAEQLKKMRKQGKGGVAGQVRTKAKQVGDKIAEAEDLMTKVTECEHVSPPLRTGYKDELAMHKAALAEHIEMMQAEDFEKGSEEAVQKAFDDLTEKLKAYSDSASMIKKKAEPKPKQAPKSKGKAKAKGKAKSKVDEMLALYADLSLTGAVEMLREGHKESQPIRKLPVILPHELLCYLSDQKIAEGEALSCGFNTIQAYLRPGQPLRFAMTELRADWKFHKDSVRHSQPLFQAKHLRAANGSEVELAAKAYNVRVITSWLADFVVELLHDDGQIERMQYCQNAGLAAYGMNFRMYHTFASEDANGRLVRVFAN
ncbi:unnamed protein product [Symbiodinium sp. KB8]|nr:unnamed protein product [Symbiodinium sp. KB8]